MRNQLVIIALALLGGLSDTARSHIEGDKQNLISGTTQVEFTYRSVHKKAHKTNQDGWARVELIRLSGTAKGHKGTLWYPLAGFVECTGDAFGSAQNPWTAPPIDFIGLFGASVAGGPGVTWVTKVGHVRQGSLVLYSMPTLPDTESYVFRGDGTPTLRQTRSRKPR